MTTEPLRLYHNPGWGSAIVAAQLAWYDLPVTLVEAGDIYDDATARAALAKANPLMQIPTLILPDGTVMTESAAITLYLADLTHSDTLVPGANAAERPAFLRWLIFLVASVYPTFVFGDVPSRYVATEPQAFQDRMIERRKELWRIAASNAAPDGPWFLGARFSAIDIYLACMVHWRPGKAWFAAETPRLLQIGEAAAALPQLTTVMARNFA